MNTNKENNQNKIIRDVARFEKDVYRVSSWIGKEGKTFLDLHVYFLKDGKYRRTKEGMNIRSEFRKDVADALLLAKDAPELPLPSEGKNCEMALVANVPISETEQYQVSKVRGPKNSFVRICYAFKGDNGAFIPNGKKALSILNGAVEGIVQALLSPEAAVMHAA